MTDRLVLRCVFCRERPLADALEYWRAHGPEGAAGWVVSFGCLPCLRRVGLRGAVSLFLRLRWISATVQFTRSLALPWIGPTAWLSEALAYEGASVAEFRARQAGKLHALTVGEEAERLAAARAVLCLLRAVAQADGATEQAEWQALRRAIFAMHLDEPQLWQQLDPGTQVRPAPSREELADAVQSVRARLRRFDVPLLLALFLQVAEAVGGLQAAEQAMARALGAQLGILEEELNEWLGAAPDAGGRAGGASRVGAVSPRSAHQVLGVSANASFAEVRRAYLKLAMKHHPDRATRLGPAMVQAANQRMKEINAAYESLQASKSR
jgi:DnaJ like chaperone protein